MKALELADAYADACFDQALNGRTEDPIPEQKREGLASELRRLAAVEAELERIKALEPVAWMYDRAGSAFNPQFLPASPNADQQRNGIVSEGVVILNPDSACKNWQALYALGSKT